MQRGLDRARRPFPFRMGSGGVVPVGREPQGGDLGHDRQAERVREIGTDEYEHAAPLAQREPLPVLGVGRGRLGRQRLQRVETRHEHVGQGVGTAAYDRVGLSRADQLGRIANRIGARGTRGVHGKRRTSQAEGPGDSLRDGLGRDEQQQPGVGVLAAHPGLIPLPGAQQASVARSDDHAPAIGRDLLRSAVAGLHRRLRRHQREVHGAVAEAFGIVDVVLGFPLHLDLAGERCAVPVHRDVAHRAYRHMALAYAAPEVIRRRTLRGNGAHTDDNHPQRLALRSARHLDSSFLWSADLPGGASPLLGAAMRRSGLRSPGPGPARGPPAGRAPRPAPSRFPGRRDRRW